MAERGMEPVVRRPSRRLVVLAVVALAMLGLWLGLAWLVTEDERKVAALVGKQLGCPAGSVRIVSSVVSDLSEVYAFEACGQTGQAHCRAPDFLCTVQLGR